MMSSFYVRLAGAVFLLLGAAWVGAGLWVEDLFVAAAGSLAAVAGLTLFSLATRMSEDAENS